MRIISDLKSLLAYLKRYKMTHTITRRPRFLKEKSLTKIKIKTSKDIIDYFIPYLKNMKEEIFKAVLLDGKNKILWVCT